MEKKSNTRRRKSNPCSLRKYSRRSREKSFARAAILNIDFFTIRIESEYIKQQKEELASIGVKTGCVRIRTWDFSLMQTN